MELPRILKTEKFSQNILFLLSFSSKLFSLSLSRMSGTWEGFEEMQSSGRESDRNGVTLRGREDFHDFDSAVAWHVLHFDLA